MNKYWSSHVKMLLRTLTHFHTRRNVAHVGVTVLKWRVSHLNSLIINPVPLWFSSEQQYRYHIELASSFTPKKNDKPVLNVQPNIVTYPQMWQQGEERWTERKRESDVRGCRCRSHGLMKYLPCDLYTQCLWARKNETDRQRERDRKRERGCHDGTSPLCTGCLKVLQGGPAAVLGGVQSRARVVLAW